MTITDESTIGSVAASFPSTISIFQRYKIDYCCGGGKTLHRSASEMGIDPENLIGQLIQASEQKPVDGHQDWLQADLTDLIDHILNTHHCYLRQEIPPLSEMAAKVAAVHGDLFPEKLPLLETVFSGLVDEITEHLIKEEQILFPIAIQMEKAQKNGQSLPETHCGSVSNPIRVMIYEHDNAGSALGQIRDLTGDYHPPESACNTFRGLYYGLAELEKDLLQHIHLENNILFPRITELEKQLNR